MNSQTRLHLNELRLQLSRLQKNQQRDLENFRNLGSLKISTEVMKKKQDELKVNMDKREKEMDELERKINSDNLESEVKKVYSADTQEVKNKNRKKQTTKLLEDEKELVDLVFKNEPVKQLKKSEFKPNPEKLLEKQMVSGYTHYLKAIDTLPDYMINNLAEMPGNKGYSWKGVWFFGELPNERNQPIVVFEKCGKDVTKIHEIDGHEYRIFEKIGKDKKKLIWTK